MPKRVTTYLGYTKKQGFAGAHADGQVQKAEKAAFSVIGLYKRLHGLPVNTKLTIGNA